MRLVGVFALLAAVRQKIKATGFFIDVDDLPNDPWPLRDLILEFAGFLIAKIEMIPAIALRGPDKFAGTVEEADKRLAGIDVVLGLLADQDFLFACFGVDGAHFDGFFAALVSLVIKALAV